MPYKYNPFTNNLDFYEDTGGGIPILSITGDTGSITGAAVTIYAHQAVNNSGASVQFTNSGTISTLNLSDASLNTFLGSLSGNILAAGASDNVAVGHLSLPAITTGDNNVAVGVEALQVATTGSSNIAIGSNALMSFTGSQTVGIGTQVLASLTSGQNNTAVGDASGDAVTTGGNNTYLGKDSGGANVSSDHNTAIGYEALAANTGGSNTVVGALAAVGAGAAQNNTLVGFQAGNAITSGSNNTGIGYGAIDHVTTGGNNTSLGYEALFSLVSGTNNTALGYLAGSNLTTNDSNNIHIGAAGTVGDNNRIRIGTAATHTSAFMQGISGVTAAGSPVAVSSTGQLSDLGFGTAGQVLTSSGAAVSPVWSTVAPGSNSWVDITGTTQAMAINTGYLADNAGLVTLTLPATAAQFSIMEVVGVGAGGWIIAQNANQKIIFGNTATTVGVGGSLASTNAHDTVKLIATTGGASTFWTVMSSVGNLTVV